MNTLISFYNSLQTALGLTDLAVLIILAMLIFGFIGGVLAVFLVMAIPDDQQRVQTPRPTTRKAPQPRKVIKHYRHVKHYNQTKKRAVRQAVLMASGGASIPTGGQS